LAYKRHFPAIDWLQSYSLYNTKLMPYFDNAVKGDWAAQVAQTRSILQEEAELDEIVRLVGVDALGFKDRMTLECARSIREDYLHQNAFDEVDTFTSVEKQYHMLRNILTWYNKGLEALEHDVKFSSIMAMNALEQIGRMKYIPEDRQAQQLDALYHDILAEYNALTEEAADDE
ncbi:MAG: V-type ATP synthase subunit A, partial [Acutalibacteraceae bacterium]